MKNKTLLVSSVVFTAVLSPTTVLAAGDNGETSMISDDEVQDLFDLLEVDSVNELRQKIDSGDIVDGRTVNNRELTDNSTTNDFVTRSDSNAQTSVNNIGIQQNSGVGELYGRQTLGDCTYQTATGYVHSFYNRAGFDRGVGGSNAYGVAAGVQFPFDRGRARESCLKQQEQNLVQSATAGCTTLQNHYVNMVDKGWSIGWNEMVADAGVKSVCPMPTRIVSNSPPPQPVIIQEREPLPVLDRVKQPG